MTEDERNTIRAFLLWLDTWPVCETYALCQLEPGYDDNEWFPADQRTVDECLARYDASRRNPSASGSVAAAPW